LNNTYKSMEKYIPLRLKSDLRSNGLPTLILLHGVEQLLINLAVDYIINNFLNPAFSDFDLARLDGNAARTEDLTEVFETMPYGERKIVCLYNAPHFYGDQKQKRDGPKISHEDFLTFLGNIPTNVCMILVTDKVDKRKSLYKNTKYSYEFAKLERSMLRGFIEDRYASEGVKIANPTINTLVELTGYLDKDSDYTLMQINNDIRKTIAHSNGNEVGKSDVTAVVSATLNTIVFALSDAVSRRKIGEAFMILHDLLISGSNNVFSLLGLLFSQLETTLKIRDLIDRGFSKPEIQQMLGIDNFRLRVLMEHAAGYTTAQLRRIVRNAYEVDNNIKTGLLDQDLALEMFIYEMCLL